MMELIQKDLSIVVPRELVMNIDYHRLIIQNIESGNNTLPYGFVTYLSNKYGYEIDKIRHKDTQNMILDIALYLHKNPDPKILQDILKSSKVVQNEDIKYSALNMVYKPKPKKNRSDLAKEIPIADFE
jgi:hypothetical protein